MKKGRIRICVLLIVSLLCTVIPTAFAGFDYEARLGALDGYEYNSEDDCWTYRIEYSWHKLHFVLSAQGVSGGSELDHVKLSLSAEDADTVELLGGGFIIDGVYYLYQSMDGSDNSYSVLLGEEGQTILKAIATCDPEQLKAVWTTKLFSVEMPLAAAETESLRKFCKVFAEDDLWSNCQNREEAEKSEKLYPLTVKEAAA